MPCPLVTVQELQAYMVDELTDDERRVAPGRLQLASDLARDYSGLPWEEPSDTPSWVKAAIIEAVERSLRTAPGITSARSGDENVHYRDEDPGIWFPRDVMDRLRELRTKRSPNTLTTVSATYWGYQPQQAPHFWEGHDMFVSYIHVPLEGRK